MTNDDYERAVRVLLRRPGIDFVHGLRSSLERDPGYLTAHREAIMLGVRGLLNGAGIFWDSQVVRQNVMNIIRDALVRVQAEKETSTE